MIPLNQNFKPNWNVISLNQNFKPNWKVISLNQNFKPNWKVISLNQNFKPNWKVIPLNQNFKPKFNVYFFCTSSFLPLTILQPETVKRNLAKSYVLVDVVGVLVLVQAAFLCGEVVNLILWTFILTMNRSCSI